MREVTAYRLGECVGTLVVDLLVLFFLVMVIISTLTIATVISEPW